MANNPTKEYHPNQGGATHHSPQSGGYPGNEPENHNTSPSGYTFADTVFMQSKGLIEPLTPFDRSMQWLMLRTKKGTLIDRTCAQMVNAILEHLKNSEGAPIMENECVVHTSPTDYRLMQAVYGRSMEVSLTRYLNHQIFKMYNHNPRMVKLPLQMRVVFDHERLWNYPLYLGMPVVTLRNTTDAGIRYFQETCGQAYLQADTLRLKHALNDRLTIIGRGYSGGGDAVTIPDLISYNTISGMHAYIEFADGRYYLVSISKLTWIDGEQIAPFWPRPLENGSHTIVLGQEQTATNQKTLTVHFIIEQP